MIENDDEGEVIGYEPGKEIHLVRNPNWDPETDYRPGVRRRDHVPGGLHRRQLGVHARSSRASRRSTATSSPSRRRSSWRRRTTPTSSSWRPSGGNRYVALNTQIPPFDDINVRKAVVAAADREALRLARGGELVGPIATHFIPPGVPGFEEAGGLEGARPRLHGRTRTATPSSRPSTCREAGYESGKYEGDEEILMVAENAGIDKRVGEVALRPVRGASASTSTFRQVNANIMYTKFCSVPEAEVAVCPNVGWVKDFNDPQSMLDPTFNGENIEPTANSNWPQLDVPEINEAMDEAALIGDIDERAEAWGEIDTMVMEQAPAIPYVWDDQANVRSRERERA